MDGQTALGIAPIDVSDPALYRTDTWQEPFRRLRAEDPVQFVPESEFGPYWSVTKYNDIMTVELDPETRECDVHYRIGVRGKVASPTGFEPVSPP